MENTNIPAAVTEGAPKTLKHEELHKAVMRVRGLERSLINLRDSIGGVEAEKSASIAPPVGGPPLSEVLDNAPEHLFGTKDLCENLIHDIRRLLF